MKLLPRELVLLLVTVAVLLFGGTGLMARGRWRRWQEVGKEQASIRQQIELDAELIEQKGKWQEEIDSLSRMLERFPAAQEMDVHWLSVMDRLATKNSVTIFKRQAGEEKINGEVYELPVECREWESDLGSLVQFLFDLQGEGAMFDVRQLLIKPKGRMLRGRFTLYCAYTRLEQP